MTAALALAGFATGGAQRVLIFRLAGPAGAACRDCGCPRPGAWRSLHGGWPARPRSAGCGKRAGPPPLVAELTAAVVLAGLGLRLPGGFVLAAAAWLGAAGTLLAWIDVAAHRLPDVLTAAAYGGTAALLLAAAWASGQWGEFGRAAFGGAVFGGGCLLLAVTSGKVGGGDGKLAASVGTLLAWFGWAQLLDGVFAGFLIGGIYGTVLLAARSARPGQRIAFAPAMLAGAFLIVLAGPA